MKRVICSRADISSQNMLDVFQKRIHELQAIKDKLEAKVDSDNADKVDDAAAFFVNEIDNTLYTYVKTIYDSKL